MNRLKELRKAARLRQIDLAKELDVTCDSVRCWENEKSIPMMEKQKRIAKLLGCSLEEIEFSQPRFGPSSKKKSKFEARRIQAGLLQRELAEVLGVFKSIIRKWERKQYNPSDANLKKLEELLDCTVDEMGFQWSNGHPLLPPATTEDRNYQVLQYLSFIRAAIRSQRGLLDIYHMDSDDVYQDLALRLIKMMQTEDRRKGDLDHYVRRSLRLEVCNSVAKARAHGLKGIPKDFRPEICSFEVMSEAGYQFADNNWSYF